jgi:hypothetical protein
LYVGAAAKSATLVKHSILDDQRIRPQEQTFNRHKARRSDLHHITNDQLGHWVGGETTVSQEPHSSDLQSVVMRTKPTPFDKITYPDSDYSNQHRTENRGPLNPTSTGFLEIPNNGARDSANDENQEHRIR